MLNDSSPDAQQRQALSALMDGDLSPEAAKLLLKGWGEDCELRACWHGYHLVGDALRSEELVFSGTRDAVFLSRLRTRLAQEAVPLATTPLLDESALARPAAPVVGQALGSATMGAAVLRPSVPVRQRHRLLAPAAVAAGFMAVAGALVVFRGDIAPEFNTGGPMLAQTSPGTVTTTPSSAFGLVPVAGASSAVVVRHSGLDRYFQAHRRQAPQAPAEASQTLQVVYEKQP